jgi:hypothetical protein
MDFECRLGGAGRDDVRFSCQMSVYEFAVSIASTKSLLVAVTNLVIDSGLLLLRLIRLLGRHDGDFYLMFLNAV